MLANNSNEPPLKMSVENVADIQSLDDLLMKITKQYSIGYVSPYKTFCTSGECLVTIEQEGYKHLSAFDGAHLTTAASHFLVNSNFNSFFGQ